MVGKLGEAPVVDLGPPKLGKVGTPPLFVGVILPVPFKGFPLFPKLLGLLGFPAVGREGVLPLPVLNVLGFKFPLVGKPGVVCLLFGNPLLVPEAEVGTPKVGVFPLGVPKLVKPLFFPEVQLFIGKVGTPLPEVPGAI